MHLPELPTIFVKGDEERKAYFTIQAKELLAAGWKVKGTEEVIEEIAGFPFMSHDDLVDSTVMALMRFRQGGFIRLPSDEPEEIQYFKQRRGGYY